MGFNFQAYLYLSELKYSAVWCQRNFDDCDLMPANIDRTDRSAVPKISYMLWTWKAFMNIQNKFTITWHVYTDTKWIWLHLNRTPKQLNSNNVLFSDFMEVNENKSLTNDNAPLYVRYMYILGTRTYMYIFLLLL